MTNTQGTKPEIIEFELNIDTVERLVRKPISMVNIGDSVGYKLYVKEIKRRNHWWQFWRPKYDSVVVTSYMGLFR